MPDIRIPRIYSVATLTVGELVQLYCAAHHIPAQLSMDSLVRFDRKTGEVTFYHN